MYHPETQTPQTTRDPNEGFIMPSSEPSPWADHIPQSHWDDAHDVARIEAQDKKAEALRTEAPKHLAGQALRTSSEGIINGSPFVDPRVADRYRQTLADR